ncbi:MAG: response regulator transcription factor [Actinocrinis sp.]
MDGDSTEAIAQAGAPDGDQALRSGAEADSSRVDLLTGREFQVFVLLGKGMSNRRISSELGVSEATVRVHVHHVMAKLRVESRLQAGLVASRRAQAPTRGHR